MLGMATVDELRTAFSVYYREMEHCEKQGAYWALLHLVVVLPDICAALEHGVDSKVAPRYQSWCKQNFPANPVLTPSDRYRIRNALLHEGSTLGKPPKSQYASFSFVEPGATDAQVHQHVSADGKNLTLDVQKLTDDTRGAMLHWFQSLQTAPKQMKQLEANLYRLARLQQKSSNLDVVTHEGGKILTNDGQVIQIEVRYRTTSSN
jgi:hypothetical protein